jgi:hypothetical protein
MGVPQWRRSEEVARLALAIVGGGMDGGISARLFDPD